LTFIEKNVNIISERENSKKSKKPGNQEPDENHKQIITQKTREGKRK